MKKVGKSWKFDGFPVLGGLVKVSLAPPSPTDFRVRRPQLVLREVAKLGNGRSGIVDDHRNDLGAIAAPYEVGHTG